MQLKSSTDYAIRIVCYLATHNGMISTTELSKQLYIAATYIPKIAKKLKDANIIVALEGVKGENIPLSAQVVGLVDAYDALLSVRPYKKKLEHDQAVQMILNGECGKFSDELLHCFKKVSSQNNWIKRSEREAV